MRFLKNVCVISKCDSHLYILFVCFAFSEYLPQGTLASHIISSEPLSWLVRIGYALNIAEGMTYLHKQGVIHRDLNSSNCLMTEVSINIE